LSIHYFFRRVFPFPFYPRFPEPWCLMNSSEFRTTLRDASLFLSLLELHQFSHIPRSVPSKTSFPLGFSSVLKPYRRPLHPRTPIHAGTCSDPEMLSLPPSNCSLLYFVSPFPRRVALCFQKQEYFRSSSPLMSDVILRRSPNLYCARLEPLFAIPPQTLSSRCPVPSLCTWRDRDGGSPAGFLLRLARDPSFPNKPSSLPRKLRA